MRVIPSSLMQVTPATLQEPRSVGAFGLTFLPLIWFADGAEWEKTLALKWRWAMSITANGSPPMFLWLILVLDIMAGPHNRWGMVHLGRGERAYHPHEGPQCATRHLSRRGWARESRGPRASVAVPTIVIQILSHTVNNWLVPSFSLLCRA